MVTLWTKKKMVLQDRWLLKRGPIHMKFSMTGQENVTFKYRWLLNRGDHVDRFDCTFLFIDYIFILSKYNGGNWRKCLKITSNNDTCRRRTRLFKCNSYMIIPDHIIQHLRLLKQKKRPGYECGRRNSLYIQYGHLLLFQ